MKNHSSDKSFLCDICGKRYVTKFTFETHMKIHYGIKDQVCFICKKSFTAKANLNCHVRNVHTNEHYSCDICEKQLKNKRSVTRHKKRCEKRSLQFLEKKSQSQQPLFEKRSQSQPTLLKKRSESQQPLFMTLDTFLDAENHVIRELLSRRKIELIDPESEFHKKIPEMSGIWQPESESQREIRIRNLVTAYLDDSESE